MSEHVREVRAVIHAKKIRGVTRNRHKGKDRHAGKDRRRDAEDAEDMGIRLSKPWERR